MKITVVDLIDLIIIRRRRRRRRINNIYGAVIIA